MRIGIITHHYVKNYGAFLQANALYQTIQRIAPDAEVEFVNVSSLRHKLLILYRSFKIHSIQDVLSIPKRKKLYDMHKEFEKLLPVSKGVVTDRYFSRYDSVVIGSDEVWNLNDTAARNKRKFGYHIKNSMVSTYAVSCGATLPEEEVPAYVAEGIKGLKQISVRDENTKRFVEKVSGRNAVIVADPTLIYDYSKDVHYVNDRIIRHPYILIYGCVFSEEEERELIRYAKDHGYRLISAEGELSYCDNKDTVFNPYEWMNLFMHASYVLTGTFHGLMFSLKFNRNFACLPVYKNRINKVRWILKYLHLEDHLILKGKEKYNINQILSNSIDYKEVEPRLERLIDKSVSYLKKIVNK